MSGIFPEPGFIMKLLLILVLANSSVVIAAQKIDPAATNLYGPVPPAVIPAQVLGGPPSDATVLFDGSSMQAWQRKGGGRPTWRVDDGVLYPSGSDEDIVTRRKFGDIQLHIEWRSPSFEQHAQDLKSEIALEIYNKVPGGYLSQYAANSGIFLQDRYEIQVLDTYSKSTYVNGLAGSIYKQHPPLVQALKPPGEWQVYDIIWRAPRFNKHKALVISARVTVFLNGILIQNNVSLIGPTVWRGFPQYSAHSKAPLRLQSHRTVSEISYRNIWVREL